MKARGELSVGLGCSSALAAVLLLSLPGMSRAETARRLADINPGIAESDPRELVDVTGTLFFTADDGATGRELWKSDGTASGTVLVRDVRPGPDSSEPRALTRIGSSLFFIASDGVAGFELWKSDGSPDGTVLVKDIRVGPEDSSIEFLTDVGGAAFFKACDEASGCELWKSDGTEAGTVLVSDIRPGADSSAPTSIVELGARVLFAADDGARGIELWKSDGTASGTVLVKDIDPRPLAPPSLVGHSSPHLLTRSRFPDAVYFVATTAAQGTELWRTDGTTAGTALARDIHPGAASTTFGEMVASGPRVYFVADDPTRGRELWVSDFSGINVVRDLTPGSAGTPISQLAPGGYGLHFVATTAAAGTELWVTEGGFPSSTYLVKDVAVGPASSNPSSLLPGSFGVYFAADDGVTGAELWSRRGTIETELVLDLNPGSASSGVRSLTSSGDRIYFVADDGSGGAELWVLNREPVAWVEGAAVVGLGSPAILDGTRSYDPEGEPLTFEWRDSSGAVVGTTASLALELPLGEHDFTLTVSDGELSATSEPIRVSVRPLHQLTLTITGLEAGRGLVDVFSQITQDTCDTSGSVDPEQPLVCTFSVVEGTTYLWSMPDPSSVFEGWLGACAGQEPVGPDGGSCQLEVTDDVVVGASFRGPQPLRIQVASVENGSGQVDATMASSPGWSCVGTPGGTQECEQLVRVGQTVHLWSMPAAESVFESWGGACAGQQPTGPEGGFCQLVITDDVAVGVRVAWTAPTILSRSERAT